MAVISESVRSSLRIGYGESDTAWTYTVSRLNTEAGADSLALLVEAVSAFQGVEPASLVSSSEYQLINS